MLISAFLPNVSVIVPAHNAGATIEECVRSLLKQNYPISRTELLIVDNASTDCTLTILAHLGDAIRVVHAEKRGPGAARNVGLAVAHGEIVAFTDADCVVDPNWLCRIIRPLEDQQVGIVGGRILAKRPCNPIEEFGEEMRDVNRAIHVYVPPYVTTANWSSRRSLLQELNGFDEHFLRGGDVELSYRIVQLGYRLVAQPDAVVYHPNERTLRGLFRQGVQHGFCSVQVLKKHRALVKEFGHQRFTPRRFKGRTYLALGAALVNILLGRSSLHSRCTLAFILGKKIGKVLGSLRFWYAEL